ERPTSGDSGNRHEDYNGDHACFAVIAVASGIWNREGRLELALVVLESESGLSRAFLRGKGRRLAVTCLRDPCVTRKASGKWKFFINPGLVCHNSNFSPYVRHIGEGVAPPRRLPASSLAH